MNQEMRWHHLARQFLGEDFFDGMLENRKVQDPLVDVYHGKNEVIVVMDLPGMEGIHSLDLRIEGDTLLVKGDFPSPYHAYQAILVERKRGNFQKVIPLGANVSHQYTSARYRKGVFEIRFPKLAPNQFGKRVRVRKSDL